MKQLTRIFLILVVVFMLVGCGATVKEALKIDAGIATLAKDSAMSVDCKAGWANGLIVGAETAANVRVAAQALNSVADQQSEEYKRCYGTGAYIAFLKYGLKAEVGNAISDLVGLGVLK